MASLPPQNPASQRRSSQSHNSPSRPELSEADRTSSHTGSAASEDSQTVILNRTQNNDTQVAPTKTSTTAPNTDDEEHQRCWICLESEVNPDDKWSSPCPCNLTAHESCLLEWIADLENSSSPSMNRTGKAITCPQCKSEIKIARPVDYLVKMTDTVSRFAENLIIPTAVGTLFGVFYSSAVVYGVNAVNLVFGNEEAREILAPALVDMNISKDIWFQALERVTNYTDPFIPTGFNMNWRLFVGLPLIPPALILSRTTWADPAFALLPLTYFVFRPDGKDLSHWPPSPSLTFAVLPYLRSAYNEVYRHTFSAKVKEWELAIQRKPREGETAEQVAQGAAENDGVFDINIDVDFVDVVDDQGHDAIHEHHHHHHHHHPAANDLPQPEVMPDDDVAADPNRRANQAAAPQPERQEGWEFRQNISSKQIMSTVLGALFMPAISSIMGDIIKYALPAKLVTRPMVRNWRGTMMGNPTGLLQEKWGRSLVGGVLFVVLKDAVVLYCKWKKARDFGERRVLDFKRR